MARYLSNRLSNGLIMIKNEKKERERERERERENVEEKNMLTSINN